MHVRTVRAALGSRSFPLFLSRRMRFQGDGFLGWTRCGRPRGSPRFGTRGTHDDVENERELELLLTDELDEGVADDLPLDLRGGGSVASHRPSVSLGGLLGGAAAGDEGGAGQLDGRHGGHVCPGVCLDPVRWRELSRRGAYLGCAGAQSSVARKGAYPFVKDRALIG